MKWKWTSLIDKPNRRSALKRKMFNSENKALWTCICQRDSSCRSKISDSERTTERETHTRLLGWTVIFWTTLSAYLSRKVKEFQTSEWMSRQMPSSCGQFTYYSIFSFILNWRCLTGWSRRERTYQSCSGGRALPWLPARTHFSVIFDTVIDQWILSSHTHTWKEEKKI